ncbi:putative reverse transcriptase domain-containing protein, partial [Tanacetum coccineum]
SSLGSFGYGGDDFLEERATGNINIKQCLRKVADENFTAAWKVLSSSGVAPYCDDTIKALEAKNPYKSPSYMPSITFYEPPLVAETDNIFGCIKSFPKCTSCGRDVGRCLPILGEFVASAPLTPLLKPDNEIRPIAVGTMWRRLVSKVAMKDVGKEMSKYLSDFQFGVGVSDGAEAVLHSVNRVLSEYHNDRSLAMLTVDFSNAFNLVDRLALLHEVRVRCPSISLWVAFLNGQESRLYIGDTHISSTTRVQQGYPLGPLLFALILHPLLHKIKDSCKLLLHNWYLDDGTVIGNSKEVVRVLDIIKVNGPGVKLLWGAVSRDTYFIIGLAMRIAANVVDLMSLLPQIHDPQSELILLRSCMVVCGGPFFGDLQWRLASLSIRFGGLNLYYAKVVSSYAFVALRAQSWVLQDHILRDSGICGMDDDYVSALVYLRDTISSFDFSGFTNKDTAPSKAQQTLASVLFSEMVKDIEVHFDMIMRQKVVF